MKNHISNIKQICIDSIRFFVPADLDEKLIGDEKWRIENAFYEMPRHLKDGALILDVAANSGIWATYVALRFPSSRIIAIESEKDGHLNLLSLLRINKISNVEPYLASFFKNNELIYLTERFRVTNDTAVARKDSSFLRIAKSADFLPKEILQKHFDIVRVVSPTSTMHILNCLPDNFAEFITGEVMRWEGSSRQVEQEMRRVARNGAFSVSGCEPIPKIVVQNEPSQYDVSVVLPIFNVEKFLPQCIDSILSNEDISIEILLVNDSSTDSSGQICDEYQKKYPFIRHLQQPNSGCAMARQNGLNHATGKYVAFVDSDDWLSGDALSRSYKLACWDYPDIVQFGYVKFFQKSGTREYIDGHELVKFENKLLYSSDIRSFLYGTPSIWRRLYKRSFLKENNINFATQFRRYDDLPFQFETLALARTMRVLPEEHYFYRLDREGQDVGLNDERLFIHFPIMEHVFDFIAKRKRWDILPIAMSIYVATHKYALDKILPKLENEYLDRIRKDVKIAEIYRNNKKVIDNNISDSHQKFLRKYFT